MAEPEVTTTSQLGPQVHEIDHALFTPVAVGETANCSTICPVVAPDNVTFDHVNVLAPVLWVKVAPANDGLELTTDHHVNSGQYTS